MALFLMCLVQEKLIWYTSIIFFYYVQLKVEVFNTPTVIVDDNAIASCIYWDISVQLKFKETEEVLLCAPATSTDNKKYINFKTLTIKN